MMKILEIHCVKDKCNNLPTLRQSEQSWAKLHWSASLWATLEFSKLYLITLLNKSLKL